LLDDKLQIQVQDDGVGMAITGQWMPPERGNEAQLGQSGIGMNNVAERMKVLYGEAGRMTITTPNQGKAR